MAAMITTVDNPHDPRLDFARWYAWDVEHGYHTSAYLDRVAVIAEHMPSIMQDQQMEEAIDEIIKIHAGGIYKKLPVETQISA